MLVSAYRDYRVGVYCTSFAMRVQEKAPGGKHLESDPKDG